MPTSTLPDLLWKIAPSAPQTYFVNSVSVSAGAASVVAGTFFKNYSTSSTDPEKPVSLPTPLPSLPQAGESDPSEQGTFGTYCYDPSGKLLWKDEFQGWQGLFWVDSAASAAICASAALMSTVGWKKIFTTP